MHAYGVVGLDTSNAISVEYCFELYANEKKALAVAKELNAKVKEIQILKHSNEEGKILDKLIREYEQLLSQKLNSKNSIGVYYPNDDSNIHWDVKQFSIVE